MITSNNDYVERRLRRTTITPNDDYVERRGVWSAAVESDYEQQRRRTTTTSNDDDDVK